jgi:hypothetical protein
MGEILNAAGLMVNIVATLILLKFGLPANFRPDGARVRVTSGVDENEVRKGVLYKRLSRFGIVLLLLGFLLQLIGSWPSHPKL